jgi:hypothetical protein
MRNGRNQKLVMSGTKLLTPKLQLVWDCPIPPLESENSPWWSFEARANPAFRAAVEWDDLHLTISLKPPKLLDERVTCFGRPLARILRPDRTLEVRAAFQLKERDGYPVSLECGAGRHDLRKDGYKARPRLLGESSHLLHQTSSSS